MKVMGNVPFTVTVPLLNQAVVPFGLYAVTFTVAPCKRFPLLSLTIMLIGMEESLAYDVCVVAIVTTSVIIAATAETWLLFWDSPNLLEAVT